MAVILNIETATKTCDVVLADGNTVLGQKTSHGAYSHSENLSVFIQEVLDVAGKAYKDLEAVAVSKGPGSYTGLRIGTATAKGLCYGLGIPFVAVDTLQAMALSAVEKYTANWYCPMIDARRMEVYTALFDQENRLVKATEAKIIDGDSFQKELESQTICFFGDGSDKCEATIVHPNALFLKDVVPSAKAINVLAQERLGNNLVEDVAYFEPYYLKDFKATSPKKIL